MTDSLTNPFHPLSVIHLFIHSSSRPIVSFTQLHSHSPSLIHFLSQPPSHSLILSTNISTPISLIQTSEMLSGSSHSDIRDPLNLTLGILSLKHQGSSEMSKILSLIPQGSSHLDVSDPLTHPTFHPGKYNPAQSSLSSHIFPSARKISD